MVERKRVTKKENTQVKELGFPILKTIWFNSRNFIIFK